MAAGRPTLRDVAQLAGVSPSTASGVFTSRASVSPGTKTAVLEAARELGYQPRRSRTNLLHADGVRMIGMLARTMKVPFPSNPFYAQVLFGAQQVCGSVGLSITYEVMAAGDAAGQPLFVRDSQVQGLIVAGRFGEGFVERVLSWGLPAVVVDDRPNAKIDVVCNQDEQGGYLATCHLLEHGHRQPPPAMISGPADVVSVADRQAGYRRALTEDGIRYHSDYVRVGDLNTAGGERAMTELLDLRVPPTAVFCCNDVTAVGALAALRQRRINVPEQCSIVGFDDIDLAAHTVPALTTIVVGKETLGAQAVWHLLERIEHPELAPRETRLSVQLVERRSVSTNHNITAVARHAADSGIDRPGVPVSGDGRKS